ncbi:MAG: hypothetical protein BJ554DRAFT_319 [Olpidium bornovanus]|uniref:Uncharacterized protein n=1 Tax=Olpidium bornovanus TaxID=278681 RepID=A0A8H8DI85_9FUNG|nr:MAG: hypothetical protein BJ554DRAFT_319 [Olpidium bornovanus]
MRRSSARRRNQRIRPNPSHASAGRIAALAAVVALLILAAGSAASAPEAAAANPADTQTPSTGDSASTGPEATAAPATATPAAPPSPLPLTSSPSSSSSAAAVNPAAASPAASQNNGGGSSQTLNSAPAYAMSEATADPQGRAYPALASASIAPPYGQSAAARVLPALTDLLGSSVGQAWHAAAAAAAVGIINRLTLQLVS